MQLKKQYLILIIILFFNLSYSQKDSLNRFETYQMVSIKNGKELWKNSFGHDCILNYDEKNEIYNFSFTGSDNSPQFISFKIIGKNNNEIYARGIGDSSPIIPTYIVKDSIKTRQKIEFISKKKLGTEKEYIVIFRFGNELN